MRLQVILNNRNRLTTLKGMVEWLVQFDVEPVILDNDSTYPPLLDWYAQCPVEVVSLKQNYGVAAAWKCGILPKIVQGEFALSDSDLDLSKIPHDWQQVLFDGLRAFGKPKCGFSLAIDDLPDHFHLKDEVINWESQFWTRRLSKRYYEADIDTTFALYQAEFVHAQPTFQAVRATRPYMARHLPWYLDSNNLPEEERYYMEHACSEALWTTRFQNTLPRLPNNV